MPPAITLFTAAPEADQSPLWAVFPGPHRGRPIAGLSFSFTRREPISFAGHRYALDISGPPGGRRFEVAPENNQQNVPNEGWPSGEVKRGGRSGLLRSGHESLTLSRHWRLRLPYPSTDWTWCNAAGGRITVGRPYGTTLRAAELTTTLAAARTDPIPRPTVVLILTALWLYLDHHNGRPAGLGDVISGL